MGQDPFKKFQIRDKQLEECKQSILNPHEVIKYTLLLSSKLPIVRCSSDIGNKEKLQRLLFPKGIVYDRKNVSFKTEKINEVLGPDCRPGGQIEVQMKKAANHLTDDLSLAADYRGQLSNLFTEDLSKIDKFFRLN